MNTNYSRTSDTWLRTAAIKLEKAAIDTARLDCFILLEDATGKDRGWLLAHPDYLLQGQTLSRLNSQVERRIKHEPLAYLRGRSEFYGREFIVSPDTLQPRPESETMIDLLRTLINKRREAALQDGPSAIAMVLDVGTGSGCLGIIAKLEFPEIEVIATDISSKCLKVAKQNAEKLGASIKLCRGDLLQPLLASDYQLPTTVLANLPYVPDAHTINQAAMFEPKQAIFGGEDGLDLYRRLFEQISQFKCLPWYVLTESLPFQHQIMQELAEAKNYKLHSASDFIQVFSIS